MFAEMRPGWQGANGPLTQRELERDLQHMSAFWKGLDLVHTEWARTDSLWTAGPSTRTLIPRVALACAREIDRPTG